ncbi:hypothetical protein O1W68_07870 [Rhodococcus sp. H36-A4]|uniref:hypothetical protein n=1 Tax=Rhodococcus sp. H36-A4 TaxID=3004353 RepID=UPI0022B04929|nr:hypothetical protein [Rhodococcus sp. H36-A4]MCZ4077852.1 hypothetical protein [Rhodococcus sp. H36-A4]
MRSWRRWTSSSTQLLRRPRPGTNPTTLQGGSQPKPITTTTPGWLAAEDAYVPPAPTATFQRLTEDDGRELGYNVWHDYARSLDKATAEPVRVYTV